VDGTNPSTWLQLASQPACLPACLPAGHDDTGGRLLSSAKSLMMDSMDVFVTFKLVFGIL